MTLFFSEKPVRNFEDATASDTEAHAHFCRAMLDRGVYPPPAQFEAWFVSLAHNEGSVDRTLEAAAEALDEVLGVSALGDPRRTAAGRGHADLRRTSSTCRPRGAEPPDEYALVIEAVREGYLLHYGESRLLAGHDPDLGLLAGDYLYALGLDRLAALGDTSAVAVLAELISKCAQAHAEGRGGEVEALWVEAARTIKKASRDEPFRMRPGQAVTAYGMALRSGGGGSGGGRR